MLPTLYLIGSNINGLNINTDKTNEMLIHFGNKRLTETATGLLINGSSIAKVETFKLFGYCCQCRFYLGKLMLLFIVF